MQHPMEKDAPGLLFPRSWKLAGCLNTAFLRSRCFPRVSLWFPLATVPLAHFPFEGLAGRRSFGPPNLRPGNLTCLYMWRFLVAGDGKRKPTPVSEPNYVFWGAGAGSQGDHEAHSEQVGVHKVCVCLVVPVNPLPCFRGYFRPREKKKHEINK